MLTSRNVVPVVDLFHCRFDKERKTLTVDSQFTNNRYPDKIKIRSHHSNVTIEFAHLKQNDPMYDEDGWDGECCMYRATTNVKNVVYLTVTAGH